jgi:hypothetical protein
MSNYYDPGTGNHVIVDGMIVERDALRIAEAIKSYDENLEVLCVDPAHAEGISEEPFVIAEKGGDGILRPVLRAWELNDLVLERIKLADNQRLSVLKTVEESEAAFKKSNLQRYTEWREEAKDVVKHIAGMKSRYTVRDSKTGDLLTFYDDRPATRS